MARMVSVGVVGGWESPVCMFYERGIILLFNYHGRVSYIVLPNAYLFSKVK